MNEPVIEMSFGNEVHAINHKFSQQKPDFNGRNLVSIDVLDSSNNRDEVLLTLTVDDAKNVRDFLIYALKDA